MSSSNRTALITKVHRILKKRYKPFTPRGEQPVLETLLFACCLENAPHEMAERVYNTVRTSFFDWNEIRVTTVKELAEVMHALPFSQAAASNLKGVLQSTFESEYCFELETIKKKNLGDAIKRLQKLEGVSPFVIAYATQVALGGHSIPIDQGALGVLHVLGVITEAEQTSGNVPGLERAIPKNKGLEFGSLLHELGAEFIANPHSQSLRDFLLTISSDAKERFPKRGAKKIEPVIEPRPSKKPFEMATPISAPKKKDAKEAPPAKKTAEAAKKPVEVAKKPGEVAKHPTPPAKKKPAPASPAKKKTVAKTLAKRKPR